MPTHNHSMTGAGDPLPIDGLLPDLIARLESNSIVLLQASPGAGKTTRVPLALLDASWLQGRKILMLEPRRLAARAAARFMSAQLGEKVGDTVGYRTRLDTQVSKQTRIEVVTEGILTRMIQADPALDECAAVIFDEFHERSLQADLGLALVRESMQALREDLRVVVMSATLDTSPLAALLGDVPVLSSEGRSFPVEERYRPVPARGRLIDQVCSVIEEALKDEAGSLLVFLPGVGEIRRVERQLKTGLSEHLRSNVIIAPLFGQLRPAEQDLAITPAPAGKRKVVLATAIAESSLTIDGIRVVIDGGQQRRAAFDPNSGMTRLVTGWVSKASAEQRKGRAGRLQPGVCYRLWSESTQFSLADFAPPEIEQADLAPLALELAQWGARAPDQLDWIDPPPAAHWQQACALLQWLDMIDAEGAITQHGKEARDLGVHPRLAHMMLKAKPLELEYLAGELAALLEERDILGRNAGSDMEERVRALRLAPADDRLKQVRQAVRKLVGKAEQPDDLPVPEDIGRLLALAYPDRIARRRKYGSARYQLSNGKGAALRDHDALVRYEWLVAAELDGKTRESAIYLAAPLDTQVFDAELRAHVEEKEEAHWDQHRGTVVARKVRRIGRLEISSSPLSITDPELFRQGLLAAVRDKGIHSLPWSEGARQWQARVELARSVAHSTSSGDGAEPWPDVSDEALFATLDTWLGPFLTGVTHWREVQNLDLRAALSSLLDYSRQQWLAEQVPERMTIPTGQTVRLDYTAENGPVLAAKLQALFGWQTTPKVAEGRVPVVIHLLSPAQRPLAVTSDLASFWQNGYAQVRKELRGRYPKHPWPEDPLAAPPQQGTKKRPPA
ncbi:ATP-dependent helicase HrpB [Marinobacter sp. CHS3-4]|uniref:ATP-dependent helicase HrpB n=1 Tax=Marinobacter sp. CHS3-4 TaxID=3045174 RepID=UPI0024B5D6C8|nr:ATP-dependent helicase HrpB [Marinobacter sp. CHS3-4]MDI9243737.1 ATP-dependent helicase HrpB [Marinobacter sp. CHS3-4]